MKKHGAFISIRRASKVFAAIVTVAMLGLSATAKENNHEGHGHSLEEKHLCNFIPENDLYIPENFVESNGMTEELFNQILDNVFEVYESKVIAAGAKKFVIQRKWKSGTVNAYAKKGWFGKWIIAMYGGLARHPLMTPDGFALVACHEIGHHIAGAPVYRGRGMSGEGQSDYFATAKCARFIWEKDDNIAILERDYAEQIAEDSLAKEACINQFDTAKDRALCLRSSFAGKALASLLGSLRKNKTIPKFDTPDPSVVTKTANSHPKAQCRLDSYFSGALCAVDKNVNPDMKNPTVGYCTRADGYEIGVRPLCWYKPVN